MRSVLATAVDLARAALLAMNESAVGEYLGVTVEDDAAATHRFEATLPGYRGWQWAVVVAAAPDADYATVSESALLPGPEALVGPDWIPWDQRVRPGDLAPGDLLAPLPGDVRLAPGYVANGDPEVDEVALQLGLGRSQVLSLEGRQDAAQRWYDGEFGPDADMAKAAASTCGQCGFYLPLAGALHAGFGVCANELSADGRVVHASYGCGAHSDTVLPTGAGSPAYEAYDDAAVELVELPARVSVETVDTETADTETVVAEPVAEPVVVDDADSVVQAQAAAEQAGQGVEPQEDGAREPLSSE